MVLELAGDRPVLGPVAGVVRPHRQLVDQHPAVAGLEQLDREHAGDVELAGDPHRDLLRLHRQVGVEVGCGGDHLVADAVALRGGDHRPGGDLPGRRAGDQGGELAAEVDPLLGEDAARRTRRRRRSPRVRRRTRPPCRRTRRGWSSGRTGSPNGPRRRPPRRRARCAGRARRARPAGARITPLSWACTSASGPGRTARSDSERVQVVGGHVLVVEGDHLAAGGDRAQGGQVGVVAHHVVGDHLRRAHAGRLGEQPQRDAQRRGGFGHHPGQLAATDDGHGRSGRWSHGVTLPSRRPAASAVVRTTDGDRLEVTEPAHRPGRQRPGLVPVARAAARPCAASVITRLRRATPTSRAARFTAGP